MHPMMKCGHAANAIETNTGKPSCVICLCTEVAETAPDLSKRLARCSYYGTKFKSGGSYYGNECGACSRRGGNICLCERPSSSELPFFEYRPDKKFDEFYCGCHSWD